MSLHDLWANTPDSGRFCNNLSGSETSAPDNMVDGDEVDNLVTKISEGVFARLSASLDTKLDQIAKSVSLM